MMRLEGYIACICEGNAEYGIMNLLLDHDKLIFNREDLLDGEIIHPRSAKKFEEKYLRKEFQKKITVVRILDSRRENFKLSKEYKDKVSIINIITAPEIEILVILTENKYKDFKKSAMKPSEYCKSALKYSNVKSVEFVKEYFSNIDTLIQAIKEYRRISNIKNKENCLYDILK